MRASRRQLLLGAGAASLALARPALAADPSDAEQLERLLALEQGLESAYAAALERHAVDRELGDLLLGHEREHVRALEASLRRLGRTPASAPALVPAESELQNRRAFARFALALEHETVVAYQDVLTVFRDERLLQPLGSIMAAGAQHEVALREVLGVELVAVP